MIEGYPDPGVLVCCDDRCVAEADTLAAELGLARIATPPEEPGWLLLTVTAQRLELRESGAGAPGPVFAEFARGRAGWRRRRAAPREEPLARAAGVQGTGSPAVIDATAGLGRDAFVLAALGCEVTLVERQPVVAALLRDGLRRAADDARAGPIVQRMRLVQADARDVLAGARTEVVLVDPMHPARRKGALVKKEMRVLRKVVGTDTDADALLAVALAAATRRVVVKRPRGAPSLPGPSPSGSIDGRSTRFDIYGTSG